VSWEHERFEATCGECGRVGIVIESSDDWGRFARRYEGFENVVPHPTAVERKRQDSRQMNAECSCGSTKIVVGERLS
jgi:hypothetical protein